jgi:LysM repeat protein
MKKHIAKFLTLSLVLSSALVFAPVPGQADVVSAATGTTTTPAKPATTKPATTTPVVTVAGDVYSVVKGDAFWKIAKKFNLTIDELAKLNPQVKDINKLAVGQKLTVKAAAPVATTTPTPAAVAKKLFHGFGEAANYRIKTSPNSDNVNLTTASAIFDEDGKIVSLTWDVMEITPTLFPSWVDSKADAATKAAFKATIDNKWETKHEELDTYGMKKSAVSGKEWYEQMNFYQTFFKGKTVAQVEEWFKKYCDAAGRPYKMAYPEKLATLAEADKAKVASFTAEEKAMLVDVTTSATMSLQDDHSLFITALKEAYEARKEIK